MEIEIYIVCSSWYCTIVIVGCVLLGHCYKMPYFCRYFSLCRNHYRIVTSVGVYSIRAQSVFYI